MNPAAEAIREPAPAPPPIDSAAVSAGYRTGDVTATSWVITLWPLMFRKGRDIFRNA